MVDSSIEDGRRKIRRLFNVFSEVREIESVEHGRKQRRGEHHQRVKTDDENLRIFQEAHEMCVKMEERLGVVSSTEKKGSFFDYLAEDDEDEDASEIGDVDDEEKKKKKEKMMMTTTTMAMNRRL